VVLEGVVLVAGAVMIAVVGVALGMLVAPRIGRLIDKEPRDRDDPKAEHNAEPHPDRD
jgi:hypothetical protein